MKNILILASALMIISVTYTADNSWPEESYLQEESHSLQSWVRVKPFFRPQDSEVYRQGDMFDIEVTFDDNGDTWETLADKIQQHVDKAYDLTQLVFAHKDFYKEPLASQPLSWRLKNQKIGEFVEVYAFFDEFNDTSLSGTP